MSAGRSGGELVLWGASVKGLSLDDQIEAARAGGFSAVSVFPYQVAAARADGLDTAALRERFERSGVRIAVVDPLTRWLPGSQTPADLPADDPAFVALGPEQIFDLAGALGADTITVCAIYDPPVDVAVGAREFAALCDRAAERGLTLALEFIPGTGIPDIARAWEIVRRADRPCGGLMLDSWHFFRSVADFDLLAQLPPERVVAMQLEDAPATPPADVAHEALHARLIPGDGELDLPRFVRTLLARGTPRLIGPEVFSDAMAELSARRLGQLLGDRVRELLEAGAPA